jgi:hypothetical protein
VPHSCGPTKREEKETIEMKVLDPETLPTITRLAPVAATVDRMPRDERNTIVGTMALAALLSPEGVRAAREYVSQLAADPRYRAMR